MFLLGKLIGMFRRAEVAYAPAYNPRDKSRVSEPGEAELYRATRRNPVIFSAINYMANGFIEAPPRVGRRTDDGWEDAGTQRQDWARRLLKNPAPSVGLKFEQFFRMALQSRLATGHSYILLFRNGIGEVVEMLPVQTSLVVKTDTRTSILTDRGPEPVADGDLIDWRVADAVPGRVSSPLRACWGEISLSESLMGLAYDASENSVAPIPTLSFDGKKTKDEIAEIDANFETHYRDVRPLLLFNGAKFEFKPDNASTISGLSADSAAMLDRCEYNICSALGIPAAVIGTYGSARNSTYSNMKEWRRQYTMDTRIPLWESFAQAITPVLPWDGMEIYFDTTNVADLQEDSNTAAERAVVLRSGGIATLNESRHIVDLEEVEGGDELLPPATLEAEVAPDGDGGDVAAADARTGRLRPGTRAPEAV